MTTEAQTLQTGADEIAEVQKKSRTNALNRLGKYTLSRVISLFITVVIGIYLTILIANMGGYVDTIMRGEIRERVAAEIGLNPANQSLTTEQRDLMIASEIANEEKRLGLDQPFIIRSFRYLTNALQLNLGRAQNMTSDSGSKQVRLIIMERMPPTLLLMGTSNLLLFFSSVYLALALSRNYGGFLDRLVIALSPTSSAPAWFYGLFFILFFASILNILPFGSMVDAPPPENRFDYALSVLKHLILPAASLFISSLFLSIYNWRTFFLIYSSEDYVELAKMKGLSSREIERRYILRPTLPTIITSFALLLIGLWTGAIITETVFNWPGLGRTLYRAIGLFDTPVIVASTIIFAYLLAVTVFALDIVYALVDPRVKVGGSGSKV